MQTGEALRLPNVRYAPVAPKFRSDVPFGDYIAKGARAAFRNRRISGPP